MSEKLHNQEHQNGAHEAHKPYGEQRAERPHTSEVERKLDTDQIKEALNVIHEEAKTAEEITADHHKKDAPQHGPHFSGHLLDSHSGSKRLIKSAQKQLSAPERQFSKLVHNTSVEAVSDLTGATIARPSGMLAGGIASLLISIAVIFICRFYGYEYNYLIGIVAFIAGFFLGLLVELLLKVRC